MEMNKLIRERCLRIILAHYAEFREIFSLELIDYYAPPGFDFLKMFSAIDVPLNESSQEIMCHKYGPEAVKLIGRLI